MRLNTGIRCLIGLKWCQVLDTHGIYTYMFALIINYCAAHNIRKTVFLHDRLHQKYVRFNQNRQHLTIIDYFQANVTFVKNIN